MRCECAIKVIKDRVTMSLLLPSHVTFLFTELISDLMVTVVCVRHNEFQQLLSIVDLMSILILHSWKPSVFMQTDGIGIGTSFGLWKQNQETHFAYLT